MSGLSSTLSSRVLLLAFLVSTSLGPTNVCADDSTELLSGEQRAYVENIQSALDLAFGAIDSAEALTRSWQLDDALEGDKSAQSYMMACLGSVNNVLMHAAGALNEPPPTSMSGLSKTNMAAARAFENGYLPCSQMLSADNANSALQWGRNAIEDLYAVPAEDRKAGTAAKARFVACVSSVSENAKHHLFIAQDALSTRVAELNKEERLERDLLGEEGGALCFIATAAYGTNSAVQIDVLRDFRDEVMMRSAWGRDLVGFYYVASPPVAEFIARHEMLRTVVREAIIDPIVAAVSATDNLWLSTCP